MIQLDNAVERYGKIILNELRDGGIKCWLAGGALRDYFMGIPVKTDYDLFFPDESNYQLASSFFKKNDAEIKWESDNGMKVKYKGKTYDLVKKFFEGAQATIDNFDFTVSQFAVDTKQVYFGEATFMDLAKRQLMINKITYPASSLSRAFRYYKKGFSMCAGEMRKLVESIQKMPKPDSSSEEQENKSSGDAMFFTGID